MKKLIQKTKKGFSLIELMIVIAIIAILAAVAIPMYGNYTDRAKIGGAIATTNSVKSEISEKISNTSGAIDGDTNYSTGLTLPTGVTVSNGGVITLNLADALPNDNITGSIILTPTAGTGVLTWACTATGGTLTQSKVPSPCVFS